LVLFNSRPKNSFYKSFILNQLIQNKVSGLYQLIKYNNAITEIGELIEIIGKLKQT